MQLPDVRLARNCLLAMIVAPTVAGIIWGQPTVMDTGEVRSMPAVESTERGQADKTVAATGVGLAVGPQPTAYSTGVSGRLGSARHAPLAEDPTSALPLPLWAPHPSLLPPPTGQHSAGSSSEVVPLPAVEPQGGVQPVSFQLLSSSQPGGGQLDLGSGDLSVEERLRAVEAELEQLRQAPQASVAVPGEAAASAAIGEAAAGENDPHEYRSLTDGVETIEQSLREIKYPTVNVGGFFQADVGYFNQNAASLAAVGELEPGADFRRARLLAQGAVAANINYMMEFDFATIGRPSFMDVWGEVTHLPVVNNVRFGQFRQPFSLTGMTSIRALTFLERPLPFQAFVPFRRLGVMALDHNEELTSTWAASVFRAKADPFGADIGSSGGWGLSSRATYLPYYDEPADGRYYLHLGLGYDYSQPGDNLYRFAAIPEFFVGQAAPGPVGTAEIPLPGVLNGVPPFADTGVVAIQDFHLWGAELAGSQGPFHYGSEFMAVAATPIGGPSAFFPGAYAQVGYFLTGEHRPYDRRAGAWGSVKPFENFFAIDRGRCFGTGAWEIAGRWSWVDLSDGGIAGGRLTDLTAGVNWYWDTNAKLQFNYIRAFLDDPVVGNSETDIFALRAQVGF